MVTYSTVFFYRLLHPISKALQPPSTRLRLARDHATPSTQGYSPEWDHAKHGRIEGFRLIRFRSPLLTESLVISFPRVTEMFQFTRYPTSRYLDLSVALTTRYPVLHGMDCSIRKPPDRRIITPPRRISLLYASFLGMSAQGIHYQLYNVAENKRSVSWRSLVQKKLPTKWHRMGSIPPYDVITHLIQKNLYLPFVLYIWKILLAIC